MITDKMSDMEIFKEVWSERGQFMVIWKDLYPSIDDLSLNQINSRYILLQLSLYLAKTIGI